MRSHTDFVSSGGVAKKDALLGVVLLRVHSRKTAGVTACRVDCKSAIDISARLIELDGLPGVLGGLADARSVDDCAVAMLRSLRLSISVHILTLDVSLYLILSKT